VFADAPRATSLEQEMAVTTRVIRNASAEPPPELTCADGLSYQYLGTERDESDLRSLTFSRLVHRYRIHVDGGRLPADERVRIANALVVRAPPGHSAAEQRIPLEVTFRRHSRLMGQRSLVLSAANERGTAQVRLWARDGQPFRVSTVTSTLPEVSGAATGAEAQKQQTVEVAHQRAASPAAGVRRGSLLVHCAEFANEPYVLDLILLP